LTIVKHTFLSLSRVPCGRCTYIVASFMHFESHILKFTNGWFQPFLQISGVNYELVCAMLLQKSLGTNMRTYPAFLYDFEKLVFDMCASELCSLALISFTTNLYRKYMKISKNLVIVFVTIRRGMDMRISFEDQNH
jgi:hypothetical protein